MQDIKKTLCRNVQNLVSSRVALSDTGISCPLPILEEKNVDRHTCTSLSGKAVVFSPATLVGSVCPMAPSVRTTRIAARICALSVLSAASPRPRPGCSPSAPRSILPSDGWSGIALSGGAKAPAAPTRNSPRPAAPVPPSATRNRREEVARAGYSPSRSLPSQRAIRAFS